MTRTIPTAFPLDLTPEEQAAGFRRMVLTLGDFVGAFPGESVEVAARRLSEFDVLMKSQVAENRSAQGRYCPPAEFQRAVTTRSGETKIAYRHLRFGYPSWRQQLRFLWRDIRFGFWPSWFRGHWPWRVDWQHVPDGWYDSPSDDCSRTVTWQGIVGLVYHDNAA